jgi:hypothetical protein
MKPWETEPDFVELELNGYKCCIVRKRPFGHLCGYVFLSEDHPLFGKEYGEHIPELTPYKEDAKLLGNTTTSVGEELDSMEGSCTLSSHLTLGVHGGITYINDSLFIPLFEDGSTTMFNKDLSERLGGVEYNPIGVKCWVIGFDCGHGEDLFPFPSKTQADKAVMEIFEMLESLREPAPLKRTYKDINFVTKELDKLTKKLDEIKESFLPERQPQGESDVEVDDDCMS